MSRSLICIAGGGTGGHVMPALALADAAREKWSDVDVSFIGAVRGLEAKLLPERGEAVLLLAMHSIQGAAWLQRLRVLLWELPCSILRILMAWRGEGNKPQVLVGVGGYASVAGVIAALLLRIPVVLYEQNAIPGLVNRCLYRFCHTMMLGFASAQQHVAHGGKKTVITGNVIRQSIQDVSYHMPEKPCLLVMGGSQGAMFLNATVPLACVALAAQAYDFSVVHLVGAGDGRVESVAKMYEQAGISAEVRHYCDDMPALFAKGSLMIARAGAMTVGEIAAVGMPALLVPLPSAADQHQYYNALSLAEVGAAEIMDQQRCSVEDLSKALERTLLNAEKLQSMATAAEQHGFADASARQLQVLQAFVGEVSA